MFMADAGLFFFFLELGMRNPIFNKSSPVKMKVYILIIERITKNFV